MWCARHLVGDEPFAVLLVDDLMVCDPPCLKQIVDAYETTGGNIVAVIEVPREDTNAMASSTSFPTTAGWCRRRAWSRNPSPPVAPSTLTIIGRYIIQPEVFGHLSRTRPGTGNEIQLTDGLDKLIDGGQPFHGLRTTGRRLRLRRQARLSRSQPGARPAHPELGDRPARLLKNYLYRVDPMSHRFDPTILREYDIRGIVGRHPVCRRRARDRPRLAAMLAEAGGRRGRGRL